MAEKVPNKLKERLDNAVTRADQAVDDICPSGNPAAPINSIMVDAWISDPKAGEMISSIESAGSAIRNAFDDLASHLRTRYNGEPDEVDADDPRAH